jgi:hypothetical protein
VRWIPRQASDDSAWVRPARRTPGVPHFATEAVSAHAAHRGPKQNKFRLSSPTGQFAGMGNGGIEGIKSFYLRVRR